MPGSRISAASSDSKLGDRGKWIRSVKPECRVVLLMGICELQKTNIRIETTHIHIGGVVPPELAVRIHDAPVVAVVRCTGNHKFPQSGYRVFLGCPS